MDYLLHSSFSCGDSDDVISSFWFLFQSGLELKTSMRNLAASPDLRLLKTIIRERHIVANSRQISVFGKICRR